nr:immunoglobulin light chain junction region [Macaca mulatta]
CQHSYDIPYNF